MHACTQQFVDRTSASVRLFDSFVNLDSCVENGFFFLFGAWIHRIRPIFSLPQLAFDLTSTPTIPDSCRQRSSISLTAVPRNHVEHSFRKHVSFEHSVSSPRPVITSRRERKKTTTPKFFSTQSTVSPLHAPSSAGTCCLHVLSELGHGAASFLATESTGTVLVPRLMTCIAGHARSKRAVLLRRRTAKEKENRKHAVDRGISRFLNLTTIVEGGDSLITPESLY